MTQIVAHRGLGFGEAENSLAAARAVVADGRFGLEIDVRLTLDGEVVVHHDRALSATDRPIETLTFGELTARCKQAREVPPLARLEDILGVWRDAEPNRRLLIELKTPVTADPKALTQAALARVGDMDRSRFALMAFDWRALVFAAEQSSDLLTIYLSRRQSAADTPQMISAWGGSGWGAWREDIDAAAVTRARAQALCLAVWTVNASEDIRRLTALGVDYLITDLPRLAVSLVDKAPGLA